MAKPQRSFVCQSCGAAHPKWAGRCEDCGAWNSIVEEATASPAAAAGGRKQGRRLELMPLAGASAPPPRLPSGIDELDRVLGGGIVPGAALLIGGDPGIGKSTLMLQAAAAIAAQGREVVYVSGEESIDQIRLRASRLGLSGEPVRLASATSVGDILATVDHPKAPALVIVDSIQTMWVDGLEQAPGTVSQLRTAAQALIHFAKQRGSAVLLIGHVTKDGQIAGPRVLEHMVDAVLYFEGDRGHQFRILRAVKNRFGPVDEIGVFAMEGQGLVEVGNPSLLFLSGREEAVPGSAVFPAVEGTRPVLVEIQALTLRLASGATPRRAVVGWDSGRLAMVLAVLEARCGLSLSSAEVYLNVAGGYRLTDPAADMAVGGLGYFGKSRVWLNAFACEVLKGNRHVSARRILPLPLEESQRFLRSAPHPLLPPLQAWWRRMRLGGRFSSPCCPPALPRTPTRRPPTRRGALGRLGVLLHRHVLPGIEPDVHGARRGRAPRGEETCSDENGEHGELSVDHGFLVVVGTRATAGGPAEDTRRSFTPRDFFWGASGDGPAAGAEAPLVTSLSRAGADVSPRSSTRSTALIFCQSPHVFGLPIGPHSGAGK